MESPIFEGKKIEVLGHPLQMEEFPVVTSDEARRALGALSPLLAEALESGRPIIAMGAARLDDPVKGLPIAIDALNDLNDRRDAPRGVAVLFGALKNPDALAGLRYPHVHIPYVEARLLSQLYAAATIVLSTSHFETMGATLMEGIAGGATAVTFGTAGQTDIVADGENGYIAAYPDPASVADCMARGLAAPFPRDAQHRSIGRRFAADTVARRFLRLLHG